MKIFLTACVTFFLILPSLWLGYRYLNNETTLVPTPYIFNKDVYKDLEVSAPILIVGDAMAVRLEKFSHSLAKKISENLSKPIKIQSFATEGEGLHRTIKRLEMLERPPLIIIYMGNIDENYENIFRFTDIPTIESNLKLYSDPEIKSLIMALPLASRLIYSPIERVKLGSEIKEAKTDLPDHVLQRKLALSYSLFEAQINEFFNFLMKRNSLLIPITTPLNLMKKPGADCYGSLNKTTVKDLEEVKKKVQNRDFKGAYNLSHELALINQSHATSLFLHGFISFRLNRFQESQKYLERAIALDCSAPRGNPIYNNIMKKAARANGFQYLDFHQYLVDQSQINHTFIDDVYPQDFYMEKLTDMLSIRIKTLLKLN